MAEALERVAAHLGVAVPRELDQVREKARSAALDLKTFLRWEFDDA